MERKFCKAFDINLPLPFLKLFNSNIDELISVDIIYQLEELILDWNYDSELTITKDRGYYYQEIDRDDGKSKYTKKKYKTRKEALLAFLIKYADIEYIYNEVRKIFGYEEKTRN